MQKVYLRSTSPNDTRKSFLTTETVVETFNFQRKSQPFFQVIIRAKVAMVAQDAAKIFLDLDEFAEMVN